MSSVREFLVSSSAFAIDPVRRKAAQTLKSNESNRDGIGSSLAI
jgi:hypothetical protein